MKLFVLFLVILLLPDVNKAQTIPNGDFENWNSTSFADLDSPWVTTNSTNVPLLGFPTVTQVSGVLGSAIRLQTYLGKQGPLESAAFVGPISYSQSPTGISGYYKCDVLGHDTAWLVVEFFSQGNAGNLLKFPILGSQSTFKQFNFSFSGNGNSDSMAIGITSSNFINNVGITGGSWVEMDQLKFTGTGITQPIPGGDFDSWSIHSKDIPIGWSVSPSTGPGNSNGVSKSTDHYTGNFSVKLTAQQFQFGSQISTGNIDSFGTVSGGRPFNLEIDTLIGYYKYFPAGSDTGGIEMVCQNSGFVLLDTGVIFSESTSWKYFEMPFKLSAIPDTMRLDVISSTNFMGSGGSTLYLDDLQLKSQRLHNSGIPVDLTPDFGITTFPNPVQNQLTIHFSGNIPSEFGIKVFNAEGKLMIENNYQSGNSTVTLPVSQLSSGLYFYEIPSNGSVLRNKFVKGN